MKNASLLFTIDLELMPDFELEKVDNPLSESESFKVYGDIRINKTRWSICYSAEYDFWWVNPRPNKTFYEILYSKYFYNSPFSEQFGYASLEKDNNRRKQKAILNWDDIEKNVSLKKGAILEIGCAGGELLLEAKKRGWANAVGIEVGDDITEVASKNIEVLQGFFLDVNLSNRHFDMIFADNVIEHVFNPIDDLKKCASLQKKGDHLILRLPDTQPYGPKLKLIDHTFHFTRKSISAFLNLAGYTVSKIIFSGFYYGSKYNQSTNPQDLIHNMTVFAKRE